MLQYSSSCTAAGIILKAAGEKTIAHEEKLWVWLPMSPCLRSIWIQYIRTPNPSLCLSLPWISLHSIKWNNNQQILSRIILQGLRKKESLGSEDLKRPLVDNYKWKLNRKRRIKRRVCSEATKEIRENASQVLKIRQVNDQLDIRGWIRCT